MGENEITKTEGRGIMETIRNSGSVGTYSPLTKEALETWLGQLYYKGVSTTNESRKIIMPVNSSYKEMRKAVDQSKKEDSSPIGKSKDLEGYRTELFHLGKGIYTYSRRNWKEYNKQLHEEIEEFIK